jgi:hypothetical protein
MAKKSIYKKNSSKDTRDFACIPRALLPRNRSGLSTIVVTVILIALSMAAVVLVWVFVNNMLKKQIGQSESCFGNFDKVELNGQYTCHDSINSILRFSLIIGDIKVDKVIVSVSSANAVKSYEIINGTTISGLSMYSEANPDIIILPGKNSGLTYNATGFSSQVDSIQIAPVIGGNSCEVSDSLSAIEECQV